MQKLIKKPTKNFNDQPSLASYQKLLNAIKQQIKQTEETIFKVATRQKVVLAWRIGKLVEGHLSSNKKLGYSIDKLFEQLTQDVSISKTVLYEMHKFYQSYPTLPKDDEHLNWGHYRVLSGIKKAEERKYLENLSKQNFWSANTLEQEVSKTENEDGNATSTKSKTKKSNTKNLAPKKLRPQRGRLFSYPLIKLENSDKIYLDLGFNFFQEARKNLPKNAAKILAVDSSKKNDDYSFKKSTTHPSKFNTYKAYVERVVDGDTIRLTIDLGFGAFHKEIIRLKGIDAAEIDTAEGKKSARFLTKFLANFSFLVIKTTNVDSHGRYVADIFLPEKKSSQKHKSEIEAQKVADEGAYLNQLLLDYGVVQLFAA